ncbi:MAG: hypothetical protein H7840_05240 [Alphaproteobacteria bacterium]
MTHGRWFAMVVAALCALTGDARGDQRVACAIEGGVLKGCDPVIRVARGQRVDIVWTSDVPCELHLHGYDLTVKPGPDAPVTLSFVAAMTGRFPMELHDTTKRTDKKERGSRHAHRPLLHVEVLPP